MKEKENKMDRPNKDPFWDHVEEVFNDAGALVRMKCKYCGHSFARGTSVSRIKWHLSGETGRNVAVCTDQVPKEVQEAAFLDMCGSNKRRKTMANSSSVNRNAISTATQEQHNEVDNLAGGIGSIQIEVQGAEQGVGEGRDSSHAEEGNHMDARETRGEASQATDQLSPYTIELMDRFLAPEIHGECLPEWSMDDAPESGQGTQQVSQVLEQGILTACGVDNWAGDGGGIQMEVQGMEQDASEERASSCLEASNDMENTNGGNHMENIAGEMMHIDRRITPDGLVVASQETREDAFHVVVGEQRTTSYTEVGNDIENMAGLRAQEETAPGCFMHDAPESGLRTEQGGQINGVETWAGDGGRIQVELQGTEKGVGEGRTSLPAEAGSQMENLGGEMMDIGTSITAEGPIANAHETRGEASQATDLVGQAIGRPWREISNFLMEDDQVENGTGGLVQPVAGTSSSGGRTHNTSESRGDALPTSSTKMVGGAFEENKKAILSWLNDDEVSRIGIYGMGGVGKTTLMRQIYDQIRGTPHVYWITVSQDFSIYGLQHRIAKCIGLDLSDEEDEMQRVFKLLEALKRKQQFVLILDDLWDHFCPEEEVGIPAGENGSKLILTTRSLKVCHWMGCEKKIDVQCLSKEEAWSLFTGKLGHDMAHCPELERIAERVAMECDGLPLGIITMAGSMRGVHDPHEWSNTLKRLRESDHRDMQDKVFRLLRFSYDRLVHDSALQRCVLYCALFPEDHHIEREVLIGYLIDEGIIKQMKRRHEEFDEGHTMLTRLENVCLLESCETLFVGARAVKMHDLIRDMAIQIQQEISAVMVKAGAQLKQMPDEEEWTENLVTVSLMLNGIEEIPSRYSPRCPRLSTLLLCNNYLQFIGTYSFFKHLNGLKILDLSYTEIDRLPDSVSDLVSLVSLLLSGCNRLTDVPSLKKLRALKRLDLKDTKLNMIPRGMKGLSNLRYLRLSLWGGNQTEFPSGILSKLSNLQVFIADVMFYPGANPVPLTVKGKEAACLRKMEALKCAFESYVDFVEYLKYRDHTQSPRTYIILVGQMMDDSYMRCVSPKSKVVLLANLIINRYEDFQVTFPNDIEVLSMLNCEGARSLCDVASLKDTTALKHILIEDCNSMESLVSSSWLCSAPELTLQSYNGIFSGLKQLTCFRCKSMKKLFPLVLLRNLINLEVIRVWDCEKMEEIIGTRDEEGVMDEASSSSNSNSITEFNLPKLKHLCLNNLPELTSICSAKLICPSIASIAITNCQKLKRMSLSLPSLENGQPCLPEMIMYQE